MKQTLLILFQRFIFVVVVIVDGWQIEQTGECHIVVVFNEIIVFNFQKKISGLFHSITNDPFNMIPE